MKDTNVQLVAMIGLVLVALAVIIGTVFATINGNTVSDSIVTIGATAVGAIGGALVVARTPAP